jgi:hypothetical protein
MYVEVVIGKHLSDAFTILNGLKEADVLSLLLFIFAFEYAIWESPRKPGGTESECDESAAFGLFSWC